MTPRRAPKRTRTPHKDRGPGNYEALGRIGRRTGAELKDPGVRDENGMEPVPSFSSPAKPMFQPNGITQDVTYSADDSMDIDQSTIPEPTDAVRSVRDGRISLPPRATSPIKTHLNSSPRRSMPRSVGPMSSPSRNLNNGTPTRATSHPPANKPVNRRLDFSPEKLRKSVESPQKASAPGLRTTKPALTTSKGKSKDRRAFDLSGGVGDEDNSEIDAVIETSTSNGVVYEDDSIVPMDDGDQPMGNSTFDQATLGEEYSEDQSQGVGANDSEMMAPPATSGAKGPGRRPGRRPIATIASENDSQLSLSVPTPPRRGRPPKKTQIFQDPDAGVPTAPSPMAKGKRNTTPSLRDPNARNKITKKTGGKPLSVRGASVGAGSRFVQRSATPANDSGALITRYGRQSIKPLATWRGEKTIMGDRFVDALPGIKEVIRVDEVVEPRPRAPRHRKGQYRGRSRLADVEEEEGDEGKAPWETDPGIMVAQVMEWDPNTNRYDEESTREEDIAYAFEAIEMRDISGADFKFAKTLTLDFFGSGMVHLPPGGAKRIKNSRKMQMVFFVFYGRVTVNIGTPPTKFSIGKGGQWQVPRGNFYSITNESDGRDARIFFAQGCEIQAGAVDESTMA